MSKKNLCKSILIAEDNDDIRDTIAEVLELEGYRVRVAKNGKEALEKLKECESPTLVLLDLMMPVMSGWEFLDAQKSQAVFAPHQVVTISAVSPTASLNDPTPLDVQASLSKPLALEPVLEIVEQFCGRPA